MPRIRRPVGTQRMQLSERQDPVPELPFDDKQAYLDAFRKWITGTCQQE
jgi:hypothetical protein